MNNDLISREALKKALHNFFDGKVIDEPTVILRDVFCYIDNAPTVNDCPNCEYKLEADYIRSSSSYKELIDLRKFKEENTRPQANNNAELFKQTFGIYATELWTMPNTKFMEWLNADMRGEEDG